jgi:poly(beta-D-mannuronate) lyase
MALGAVFAAAVAAPLTLWGLGTATAAPRPVSVTNVSVTSVPGLTAALARAVPGDRITVAAGVYTSGTLRITRSGTAAAPIRVAAAGTGASAGTGAVEMTGAARIEFGAVSHVVLEGFTFTGANGLDVPPSAAAVRITRNTFNNVGGHNVVISADNSEVDHNAFLNKSSAGVYLQVNGPGASGMAKNVHVHHNYFFNHHFGGANGGESIRFGLSGRQHGDARGLVEYNLLERADGDSEAISIKSSNNVVRYNTFLNSRGTLSLRHGWGTTVDGNYIIGGRSGIRFFGNNHTVINNVVQDSAGQPLEVGGGEIRDDTNSTTAHEAADHCVVLFNTFVGTGSRVVRFGSDKPFDPSDINLSDNIFVGHGGSAVAGTGARIVWGGNILFGSARGTMPTSGYRAVDPRLARGTGNLFRLSTGSPAVNAATGSFPQVTLDMDLVARAGAKDVGADELGGAQRRPLTRADVGPSAP